TLVLVATFLTLSSLCVQGSPEDGLSRWKDQSVQQPADDPLLRWMNKIAQQELQAREHAIAQIRKVAAAERRQQGVREEGLLALKGFVVLCFDPIGQGEREQTYDPQLKAPAAGWSVNEHIQAGAQGILVGQSVARYFIWDAKRALDYLLSRPEVDAANVGAAGCSGGGALTMFIGALDPRLKAIVPACFPTSYRRLFAGA